MTSLKKAIKIIKKGGVIITPSESSYGFSCDATNAKAIKRIHKIKKEPQDKSLTIVVSNIKQIKKIGKINKETKKIIKNLMPCQLNLIIPEKQPNKYEFLSKKGISFRIPLNKILFNLAKKTKTPIVTTSANIHGKSPIYKIEKIKKQFQDKVDLIINSGDLNENIPTSTIYDTRTKKIIRQSLINKKTIEKHIKNETKTNLSRSRSKNNSKK